MISEGLLYLLPLPFPEYAVVDEDAGQLIADGPMQEYGGHGGTHASGKPENDVVLTDGLANLPLLLVDERGGRPVAATSADVEHEVLQHQPARIGVHNLGMKLDTVVRQCLGPHSGHRRVVGVRDDAISIRQFRQAVAVAHPDGGAIRHTIEEPIGLVDDEARPPEFSMVGAFDDSAGEVRHRLETVAD